MSPNIAASLPIPYRVKYSFLILHNFDIFIHFGIDLYNYTVNFIYIRITINSDTHLSS